MRLWTRPMPIGFQSIRDFEFAGFLGVEMLKIRGVLCLGCGGQHLTFLKEADAAAAQRFR